LSTPKLFFHEVWERLNMKLISVVTACYNEEENVEALYKAVKRVFEDLDGYTYEHIFIDNASKDRTVAILKGIAQEDNRVKIIVNNRNFGHIRSPFHGLMQSKGDAVISVVADFQDPPGLIKDFIASWEEGYSCVLGVKTQAEENRVIYLLRSLYYRVLNSLSDSEQVENFTGFGLYDKRVIDILRSLDDPYPYFRGLIAELGFESAKIEYVQPARRRGITKNNFYTLYDMAMLGLTAHSKVPLRISTMVGFIGSGISLLVTLFYFAYKLLYWTSFSVGQGPLVIGLFFFASVQLFFLGIIGEYVGSIHTQVLKRPRVVEKERINF
jgi:polyisoprenyl-phosphate glycosyltransferase